jgi:DNA-directed RNA polymerase specialized sigma24 family protein
MITNLPPDPLESQCQEALRQYLSGNIAEHRIGYVYLLSYVKRYVSKKFRNLSESERESCIADVLYRIHRNGHTQKERCVAWLNAIASNACRDEWRKIKESRKNLLSIEEHDFTFDDAGNNTVDPTVEREEMDCLHKVLAYLEKWVDGPNDAEILKGLILGESHDEIAKRIGRSSGAVATRVAGLRKELKRIREELC